MVSSEERSLLVIGGGISGLTFAWHAARAGETPLVLEASSRVGGCLDTRKDARTGLWYELGAHTAYNSYGSLIEVAEQCPTPPKIIPRNEARKRFGFLRDGALSTMGPLSVFKQFGFFQLATHAPFGMFRSKEGRTTAEHFGRMVGKSNYREILAPFLSAVPSQPVDEFPATGPGSLFKKRPRRKDIIKSFTFDGGLGSAAGAIASDLDVSLECPVSGVERTESGYRVTTASGRTIECTRLAVAVDAATAARLLAGAHPDLATALGDIATVTVDSVGLVVDRASIELPELAFVVPKNDIFWSAVTRDPVPDDQYRAFAFHFKPGQDEATQRSRIAEVLGIPEAELPDLVRKTTVLPAPARNHAATVSGLDELLAGQPLALLGNYFAGLAIEDCVLRSKSEWQRFAQQG